LTAEPEPPADGELADPVAEQIAELNDGLFGEDGLVARLEDSAVDQGSLDARISEAVSSSERRLSAHIDEAVLALAEALFRTSRRPARATAAMPPPAPVVAPPAPVAPPIAAVAEPAPDAPGEEYDDEELLEEEEPL